MTDRAVAGSGAEQSLALRAVGLRVTVARVAVLRVLGEVSHADTDTVIRRVHAAVGAVSPQAVYNVLADLLRAGLVRRIEPAGSVPLYELRVADNHHHVVCRRCGAVDDVDCAVGEAPCLNPSQSQGYLLDEAEVTYWGICPTCQLEEGRLAVGAPPFQRRTSPAKSRDRMTSTAVDE